MKIAIIGAGSVGRALGGAWSGLGHDVRYGVRKPSDAKHASLGTGRVAPPDEAIRGAEVIVMATPWSETEAACRALGPLQGRLVIDCTNPLTMGPAGLSLAVGFSDSGGERVQSWCRGAHVFKTLNQTGFETMAMAARHPVRPVMFVAGDDKAGKEAILALVAELGFEAIDAGPLVNARLLEAYAMLWIDLAFKRGQGRTLAFALTRLPQ